MLRLFTEERTSTAEVVAAVESDVALAIAVLRVANQVEGKTRGRVDSVVKAVELLSPEAVQALASRARTFDFFERTGVWDVAPEQFRLHALASQRAADRLASEVGYEQRDRLMVTALLHDIGKLVLLHAYPGYPQPGARRRPHAGGAHPSRAARARRRPRAGRRRPGPPLGAAQGRSPRRSSATTPRTPTTRPRSCGWPTCSPTTRRARPVSPSELLNCARAIGFGPAELRSVMYELPYPTAGRARARSTRARCPTASSTCSSAWPRARSTSRSPRSSRSRRARSAPTCTTSTASSAPSTAPRPSWSPPSAAGSGRPPGAQRPGDRDAGPVDRPVDRRAVAAVDEGLVELVGRGVGERDRGREPGSPEAEGPQPQPPQQAVLGHVHELAADEVDRAPAPS